MTSSETAILVAIVGLLAAVLGGVVQALFARGFERFRFEREAKWELYSKYFLALGELSFSEGNAERHKNGLSLLAQLRGRIGVVGSPAVIRAVGETFKHADLRSEEAQIAMAKTLAAMREDVGKGRDKIDRAQFIQLMFGSRELKR